MHYVKQFNINGVDTKQIACIELHGRPNAATEGAVGVLGIDVDSPLLDVYKCVAVNGNIYTWHLLSSGLGIISATIAGGGAMEVDFPYDSLRTPVGYVIQKGDLIFDREGYLYQIKSLDSTYCTAIYSGTQIGTCTDYNLIYPVGSIYMSTVDVSPASFIGGAWERIKDRFLLSAGDIYVAGRGGGEATHSHDSSLYAQVSFGKDYIHQNYVENEQYWESNYAYSLTMSESTDNHSRKNGVNVAGTIEDATNMPPYLTVYVWQRIG
jgi:hypothetical protein